MQYDFDTIIDRNNNNSAKYDERAAKFGTGDVIPLWIADMDFKTAPAIIDALKAKAEQGIYGYTSRPDSYFAALADWQKRRNNFSLDVSMLSFCPGVVPAISALVHQFSSVDDYVLITPPVYPEFKEAIEAWGRKTLNCQLIEKDGNYEIDFVKFEECLKKSPKLFILCHPHNPVGKVWTDEELVRMAELCIKYGVLVVSDEIHSDLLLWKHKHHPLAGLSGKIAKHVVTCTSITKTFNLAGLQASAVLFPDKEIKEHFDRFWKNIDIKRNSSFSVSAIEAAYRHGEDWLEQLITYIEGNMTFAHDYCREHIPGVTFKLPQCTYLIWLDCRGLGLDDAELARFMSEKAGLGMNSGVSFGPGGEGYMRLNAACPRAALAKALKQLENAVKGISPKP